MTLNFMLFWMHLSVLMTKNTKYLNFVLEHAMEDEYWFSGSVTENTKERLLKLLKEIDDGN